eukprot:m.53909 g.53909  ORF g.53909 m.53909 type:complete len:1163 (-) comp11376_c0_seq3:388-3876(-)
MGDETVKVIVRCRPMNSREKGLNCKVVVDINTKLGQVKLRKPGSSEAPKPFTFDGAYGMDSNSKIIYEDMGFPLIENVLDGYNGTIFAYGQTGCGKSFTMEGIPDPPEHRGLTPRSFEHIFQEVAVRENTKFLVRASYLEIYNENVRDLLGKDHSAKLDLKEHPDRGVYVKDLTEVVVHDTAEMIKLMAAGSKNRSVGATLMNADSSRSHSIFTVWIEAAEEADGDEKIRASKLNLVDLAGSERQGKTGATGDRLKEATKINLSLSALGNVISALVDGKAKHIPYRDSKLTRLLQDSLGGNTKTLMMAALSPADNNYDETLSTLRYANRAKNIKNKAVINEDPKDALLRQYQEEIKALKAMLEGQLDPTMLAALTSGALQQSQAPAPTTTSAASRRASTGGEQAVSSEQLAEIEARITAEKEEELKQKEEAMKQQYDAKLAELEEAVTQEKMTNGMLEEEFERITREYDIKRENLRVELKKDVKDAIAEEVASAEQGTAEQQLPAPAVTISEGSATRADQPKLDDFEVIPQVYVVVDKDDKWTFAVRQAGNPAFFKACAGDGFVNPLAGKETRRPIKLDSAKIARHKPVKHVRLHPARVLAARRSQDAVQPIVALLGPNDEPIAASVNELGVLKPDLQDDGEVTVIMGSDALPVPFQPLQQPTKSTPNVAKLPFVVAGRDGAEIALLNKYDLPVAVKCEHDTLSIAKDSAGKETIIIGPDGLPAEPVVCKYDSGLPLDFSVRAVVCEHGIVPCIMTPDGVPVQAKYVGNGLFAPDGPDGSDLKPLFQSEASEIHAVPVMSDSTVILEGHEPVQRQAIKGMPATPVSLPIAQALATAPAGEGNPAVVAELQAKLAALQKKISLGGGKAVDPALKAKLKKRKKRAEERRRQLEMAKSGEDGALERIYDNLQDEIKDKRDQVRRARETVSALEQEIKDIQSEFEREREDLLESLRSVEQSKKFFEQYVDKVLPLIKQDCNYANLTKIRSASVWNPDTQRWMMPDVTRNPASLPGGSLSAGRDRRARSGSGKSLRAEDQADDARFRERMSMSGQHSPTSFGGSPDIARRYGQRGDEINGRMQERARAFNHSPLESARAQQLLSQDPLASLNRGRGGGRKKRAEPGAVSIASMSALASAKSSGLGGGRRLGGRQHKGLDDSFGSSDW